MQSPLRNLRKSQGLTLSHVANVVDIDPANLRQQIASLDVAERLVKFYSGQIDELQILYPHRYTQATETGAASVPQKKGKPWVMNLNGKLISSQPGWWPQSKRRSPNSWRVFRSS
jgi:hypothetical protein